MDKGKTVKYHFIFWLIVVSISFLYLLAFVNEKIFIPLAVKILLSLINDFISFYLFYFLISPKFFTKKGIVSIVLLEILYLFVSSFIFSAISFYFFKLTYSAIVKPYELSLGTWISNNIYSILARNLIFSILGGLSKVSYLWYENQVRQKETEKQNIINELAMLRAQINPHFLFNTLNNIKSLVMYLPSKAKFSTDKLINIMNYMLFESSIDKVPFGNEIEHIKNYLELEKIRFINPDYTELTIAGDYNGIMIPPLIFMPFIENTFKHGDKLKPAPGIKIKFDISKSNIFFEIENHIKENYVMHDKKSGFGLANTKRRLDLLFGNKYDLVIENKNNIFNVKLNLNIL